VLYELLTGEPAHSVGSLAELGAEDGFDPPDLAARVPAAPSELVAAVTACLSVRSEDRPESAAALARLLAPVGSQAETLSLPPDPAQRATEILARPTTGRRRRWTTWRVAAVAALVTAGILGLTAVLVLNTGDHSSPPTPPHAVAPPRAGASVADQARNLASWLRQHQG
jgi:hypothetical protein